MGWMGERKKILMTSGCKYLVFCRGEEVDRMRNLSYTIILRKDARLS